jgi:phospholipid/cholesterol/gamma-HCH transport system permease protein
MYHGCSGDIPLQQLIYFVESIGTMSLRPVRNTGQFVVFLAQSLRRVFYPPLNWKLTLQQLEFVGNRSIWVIILAGIMTGAIFGFQLGEIFRIFGAETLIGAAAGFTLSKELAPVVSAMLVTGRAGSAMAAEIASMRVNEQIDAMRVMAVNPLGYLVAPRLVAGVIMLPLLTAVFTLSGVLSSFAIGVLYYDIDVAVFTDKIRWIIRISYILDGLQKAVVFGLLVTAIGCYSGYYADRGARGVGQATTKAVVWSMLAVLIADFCVSFVQFKLR